MQKKTPILLAYLILTLYTQAQQSLVYDNFIYDSKVNTVLLSKAGLNDLYAIITLNSNEQLQLGFDMLGNKNEFFQYTVVHCDANWVPTPMQQSQYIQGPTFDNINDYSFSRNTFVRYVHYNLLLPNENMKLTIAGNYLLKVYRNFDESDLVITRRMMVLNPVTTIDGKAIPSTLAQYRFTKQEMTFTVNYKGYNIINPFEDVKPVILQNGRWDNAVRGVKPQYMHDNILEYTSFEQMLYNGGNEFRYFDIRNLRQVSPNVRSKTFDSVYHAYLNYEESRGSRQYFQYADNNGRRIIENKEGSNGSIDGDYAWINFFLISPSPDLGDVYVFGELTDWKLLPSFKMDYNANRGRYDLSVLLKQGRYEYLYAVKNSAGEPDEYALEGSFSNTENEYYVLIYARNVLYKYDELIGARKFTTSY